jgi:hypothetical protein
MLPHPGQFELHKFYWHGHLNFIVTFKGQKHQP